MKRKIYHLSSCSTCIRIIKELGISDDQFEFQDIKSDLITIDQIDEMAEMRGSYESLFSRRAMKYKSMGLANEDLKDEDYKKLILEEYTFLKRPVIVIGDEIFVGNSKKNIEAIASVLEKVL